MMQEALKNEEHALDVRQLSAAVDALGEKAGKRGAPVQAIETPELDLETSYPAFGAAEPAHNAAWPTNANAEALKHESELLRGYLTAGAHQQAYKSYIEKAQSETQESDAGRPGAQTAVTL